MYTLHSTHTLMRSNEVYAPHTHTLIHTHKHTGVVSHAANERRPPTDDFTPQVCEKIFPIKNFGTYTATVPQNKLSIFGSTYLIDQYFITNIILIFYYYCVSPAIVPK